MVGNDALGRVDFLGLVKVGNVKLALDTVHEAGMKAHRSAEEEYLEKVKNSLTLVTVYDTDREGDEWFKPGKPREYGGRLCEKCVIDESGSEIFSYYVATRKGAWPKGGIGAAQIIVQMADSCDDDDKQIGWWHTHPSKLLEVKTGTTVENTKYHYYWSGASSFSGSPSDIKGDHSFVSSKKWNSDGLPFFVTYRAAPSNREWTYKTDFLKYSLKSGRFNQGTVRQSGLKNKELLKLEDGGRFAGWGPKN